MTAGTTKRPRKSSGRSRRRPIPRSCSTGASSPGGLRSRETAAPDALAHYTAATALVPDAQSALLGASEAAVMTADVGAAVAFVQRLSPRSEQSKADPWRVYSFCAGRDVNDLMAALWAHVRKSQ